MTAASRAATPNGQPDGARSGDTRRVNAMTVDVEDYFQVQALSGRIARSNWESIPARVEANTDTILALFDEAHVRATFFTLGWIAQRHPVVVRRIVDAGHELASHGWDHTRAHAQNPAEFRADVGRARRLLEDVGGVPVRGYRAATFSIGPRNLWAFAALESEGYGYSSSINPIRHDYTDAGCPASPVPARQRDVVGISDDHGARARPQLPVCRRRVFPAAALRVLQAGAEAGHRADCRPGISISTPGRSIRPAAGGRYRPQIASAPLYELAPDASALAPAAGRVRLGIAWTGSMRICWAKRKVPSRLRTFTRWERRDMNTQALARTAPPRRAGPGGIAAPLVTGLVVLGLLFHAEIDAAVRVWIGSTAYNHCFLVIPIAAYLVWDRRDTLGGISARPIPALGLAALPLSIAWFAAERVGFMEGRQLIAITCVELLFLAVLGWRAFWLLCGPLLYLYSLSRSATSWCRRCRISLRPSSCTASMCWGS